MQIILPFIKFVADVKDATKVATQNLYGKENTL
jgi:hypothetical protein